MSNTTISPNMGLIVPTVGSDPGPDWATNLNADLSILDGHDHTPGRGAPITSASLNINSDLNFLGNNAIGLRSTRFIPQSVPLSGVLDLGCLSVAGIDLYYNDVNGNQIRITQSGGVAGSPGSIGSLTPPASVNYVSGNQTFVFQSNVSTPANLDGASLILRNLVASSKGLTLSPPNAMASNYTIVLPPLPATTSYVTIDASGNQGTASVATVNLSLVQPGTLIPFSPTYVPSGYLIANGSAVSRTTYATLFAAIGTTYGSGDGSTTFNVPNAPAMVVPLPFGATTPSYVQSYWHMDGTTDEPNVIQPSGYDLTMSGFVGSAPGLLDNCRGPFSNTDLLSLVVGGGSPYDNQTIMIDGYFKTTAAADQTLLDKSNDVNAGWTVKILASGQVQGLFLGGASITSAGVYNDGNWHYFNLTKLGTSGANNIRLYVDNTVTSVPGTTHATSSAPLAVGRASSVAADPMLGYIDDISISSSSPPSIAATNAIAAFRYNNGFGNLFVVAPTTTINYLIKT